MKNKLQRYFPIIRTRKEILNELRDNDELWSQFESWEEENQEEYLDICKEYPPLQLCFIKAHFCKFFYTTLMVN